MPESRDFSYESKDQSAKHKDLPVFSFPPMSRRNSKTAVHTCVGGSIDSVQHSEFLLEKSLSDIDSHVDSHAHQTADVQSHKASNNCNANNACKANMLASRSNTATSTRCWTASQAFRTSKISDSRHEETSSTSRFWESWRGTTWRCSKASPKANSDSTPWTSIWKQVSSCSARSKATFLWTATWSTTSRKWCLLNLLQSSW